MKENYTVFIEYMEGILANKLPSKFSNSRHNLSWINRNLKRLIRKKGRRFRKGKKSGMDEDRARYLAHNLYIIYIINVNKIQYFNQQVT